MNDFFTMLADTWASILETLQYMWVLMPTMLEGAWMTLKVFFLTLIFALPLGLPFALGSISRVAPLQWLCKFYIWVFRGTPLMLQLFFFYFFLPIAFDIRMDNFTTAVLTFILNYAAYFAEIYRSGIESIDKGQYEAAQSLGIKRSRTMLDIILPQTVKRVLPPVANETITLIKDTALISVISASELLRVAKGAVNRDGKVTAYVVAAIIYLIFTFVLTVLSQKLEKKFSYYERKGD